MNADEVIKALRNDSHFGCPAWHEKCTQLNESAADIIESLQDELNEYRKKEADGRLVVLPCKVGDTVYEVAYGCGAKDGYGDEGERCRDCSGKGNCEKEGWHINELKFTVSLWGDYSHMFGKDKFLTREEAEAAQKAQEQVTRIEDMNITPVDMIGAQEGAES